MRNFIIPSLLFVGTLVGWLDGRREGSATGKGPTLFNEPKYHAAAADDSRTTNPQATFFQLARCDEVERALGGEKRRLSVRLPSVGGPVEDCGWGEWRDPNNVSAIRASPGFCRTPAHIPGLVNA